MADFKWKDSEKKAASRAYEKARVSELDELIHWFKTEATKISEPDQLWALVDGMKKKQYEFEQKYDYRYSVLITVLARLIAEGRISTDDLAKLDEDKLSAIVARSDFFAS